MYFHLILVGILSISILSVKNRGVRLQFLVRTDDANKKILCMSLPKCVLPFLTNQVAQLSHVVI